MKSSLRTLSFVLAMSLAGVASAAESQFLFLKGQKSGMIKGSVIVKGQEGSIQVDSVYQEVVSPRDPQTGMPTGQTQHKPFVVNVPLDNAWPILFTVMTTNENLSQVLLRVLASNAGLSGEGVGVPVLQRTVALNNANISDIKQYTVFGTNGKPDHDELQISFTYQSITMTWSNGGITATDDWETRN